MSLIQHFVNGKSYKGNSNRKGKVFNPATGEQESEVILGSKEDLNNTVNIARKAFESSKMNLVTAPILHLPDSSEPFVL